MRYKALPLITLLAILACGEPKAATLRQALEGGDYGVAGQIVQQAPAGQHRAVLLSAGRQNMVPAQWMLAGDYWRSGEVEKAVIWAFIARMGTVLDASACFDRRAEQVDRYVAHNYSALFLRSGRDPALEQRALRDASAFHQQSIGTMVDPEWTCRYWAAIDPQQRPIRDHEITNDKKINDRKRALQKILRRGRIDLGIPLEANGEKDPIKRSLIPSGIPKSWLGAGAD